MHEFPAMNKYVGLRATRYDEKRTQKAATQRDQATVENYLAKMEPGASVLDIPAGTGRFIEFCIAHGLVYTGVDISQDMLEVARSKIPVGVTNADLQVADARSLPFPDDKFDYAIVVKFIKWLPTIEILTDALREIGRVTRKEALVQITVSQQQAHVPLATRVAQMLSWLPLIGGIFADPPAEARAGGGSRAYSQQELARAFSAAGLNVHSVVRDGPSRKREAETARPTVRNFYVLSKQPVPENAGAP